MKLSYEELEAKCAALAAENAGLKSAIEKHADSYIMCGYCRTERDGPTLEELLGQCNPENRHQEYFCDSQGKEMFAEN